MKKNLITLLIFLSAFTAVPASDSLPSATAISQRRINFFVTNRSSKLDWSFTLKIRARIRSLFDKGSFFVITGQTDSDIADRIIRLMKGKHAKIGSIWFDSHGHYGTGHSVFDLGTTGFDYTSLRDTVKTKHLKRIAFFFDSASHIGIGSCYGGATFEFPAIENLPARKMNGDSLIIYTSMVFNNASVYASESFVMMKPGIWKKGYALAGYPLNLRFKDKLYQPVWERLGQWNRYSHQSKKFERINTVCLSKKGDILIKGSTYLTHEKYNKKWMAQMKKLKRGRFNSSFAYQHRR